MLPKPIITLTSDFGYEDPFVGVVKGVILSTNPHAEIIDLSHGIRAHDIREAAFTIGMNYGYFPKNTIHMVVVDPGVGSERRPIIVMTDNHFFVGPDNGVFSYMYMTQHETLRVVHITAEHYFVSSKGATFHARDIFAPAAAYLSRGVQMHNFGEPIEDYTKIPLPYPQITEDNRIRGEVILIDKFGNAITNIRVPDIRKLQSTQSDSMITIQLKDRTVAFKRYYSQAKDKNVYAVINSSACLEFFIYRGNASAEHNISTGDIVDVLVIPKTA